ncbi:MAG: acyl carrier protein [Planctomycetes bacterium]|nr:acyl carrier protein [Planctomycetota bacterium]
MGEQSVVDRVRKVAAKILKIDESEIKPESHFVKDLGAQSIQSVELVAAFEEEFGIEMDEDEALEVKTVGDAVEFIQKLGGDQ